MQFEWSSSGDFGAEDREVLLNDFKKDYAEINGNDLEQGLTSGKGNRVSPPPPLSAEDATIASKQPNFHNSKKSLSEIACGCCVATRDLNKREQKYFIKFQQSMISEFDSSNELHEYNLQLLYQKVFKRQPNLEEKTPQGNFTMVCEEWKDIGFQGKNPRTDFRGGGHLSLLCLLYMIDNYPNEFEELAKCTKD